MPRPHQMLRGRDRQVVLVGQAPDRVQPGVALTDGVSYFEVLERRQRADGPWVRLQNMELKVTSEFRLEDCNELRIAGNAQRIKEKQGWMV